MDRKLARVAALICLAALLGLIPFPSPAVGARAKIGWTAPRFADFNGDGRGDLAIGVRFETLGDIREAGAANLIYGATTGLTAAGDQFWHQGKLRGQPGEEEQFGYALATGDFNGDGYTDLAVGVKEEVRGQIFAGAVNVIYGTRTGLDRANNQLWHQDSPGIADVAEAGDGFGNALAAGDFNGDGYADLAVGVTGESFDGLEGAGAVNVIYGSATGLTARGNQFWTQDSPGIPDDAEWEDSFGFSLATGDFNGDGFADLAVGIASEDLGPKMDAGAVQVVYGSASGLTATGSQFLTKDTAAERASLFGYALAAGDYNGDRIADLAIGVPGERHPPRAPGAVDVLYGSSVGLVGIEVWNQDSPGVDDIAEIGDFFGSALAAGDFDGDGFEDLAIGVPGEAVTGVIPQGAVNILLGSEVGLFAGTGRPGRFWHQGIRGVRDRPEDYDSFGAALAAGNFNGDGFADLAVGVPWEDIGDVLSAGAVNGLYGSGSGLSSAGGQFLHQGKAGIEDEAEYFDTFGWSLAAR